MGRVFDLITGLRDLFQAAGGAPDLYRSVVVDGAVAGNVAVTGIAANDQLVSVTWVKANTVELEPGDVAGDHVIATTLRRAFAAVDLLSYVWEQDGVSGLLTDLTSEFDITGASTINNGGGTNTSGDVLVVGIQRIPVDLTSEFSVDSADTIDNTGGTDTSGDRLIVTWLRN